MSEMSLSSRVIEWPKTVEYTSSIDMMPFFSPIVFRSIDLYLLRGNKSVGTGAMIARRVIITARTTQ